MIRSYLFFTKYIFQKINFRLALISSLSILVTVFDLFFISLIIPLMGNFLMGNNNLLLPDTIKRIIRGNEFINEYLTLLAFTFLILKVVISSLTNYYKFSLIRKIVSIERERSLSLISNSTLGKITSFRNGEFEFALTSEFQNLFTLIKCYFNNINNLLLLLGYLSIVSFVLGFEVILITAIYSLFFYGLFILLQRVVKKTSIKYSQQNNEYLESLIEGTSSFRYLRIKNLVNLFFLKVLGKGLLSDKYLFKLRVVEGILNSLKEPISVILVVLIVYTVNKFFNIEYDNLIIGFAILWRSYNSLFSYFSSLNNFFSYYGSYNNYLNFYNRLKNQITLPSLSEDKLKLNKIELKNVSFKNLFNDVNLFIKKGDFLLVTGESGSGKSTLLNIIANQISSNGQIQYFDVDNTKIEFGNVKLGFIDQNSVVFNDTLLNNLTLWEKEEQINFKLLDELISIFSNQEFLCNLHEVINSKQLSGGQRQMINIIRELYCESDLILMDEPTSSIDILNTRKFYEYINGIKHNKIIILISHEKNDEVKPNKFIKL